MRETRSSGSEGGGTEYNRFSLPLSLRFPIRLNSRDILRRAQNDMLEGFRHHLWG